MLGMISLNNHKGSRFLNSQYNDGKIFDGFVVFILFSWLICWQRLSVVLRNCDEVTLGSFE